MSGTIQYHPSSLALVTGINTDIVLVQMSYMIDKKKLTKLQRGPWLVGEPPLDWGFFVCGPSRMRCARGLCLCPLHAFLIHLKDALP